MKKTINVLLLSLTYLIVYIESGCTGEIEEANHVIDQIRLTMNL